MRKLFISAWNDSGGTYTCRLLDAHPQLLPWPYEMQLGTGHKPDLFQHQNYFKDKYRWPSFEGNLEKADATTLFDSVIEDELKSALQNRSNGAKHKEFLINADLDEWRKAFVTKWNEGVKKRATWVDAHITSFFDTWRDKPEKNAVSVLAHCPVWIMDAEKILADFPDAHILHVVRSVEQCYSDFLKRHPQVKAIDYVKKWLIVNMYAYTMAMKYPASIRLAFFHDISEDTVTSLNPVLKWAGLDELNEKPVPTWCGKALNLEDMGPFGGVPAISNKHEENSLSELPANDRVLLKEATAPLNALLDQYRKDMRQ
jgi:hypothetical protein